MTKAFHARKESRAVYFMSCFMEVSSEPMMAIHIYKCGLQENFKRLWLSSSNEARCTRYW